MISSEWKRIVREGGACDHPLWLMIGFCSAHTGVNSRLPPSPVLCRATLRASYPPSPLPTCQPAYLPGGTEVRRQEQGTIFPSSQVCLLYLALSLAE